MTAGLLGAGGPPPYGLTEDEHLELDALRRAKANIEALHLPLQLGTGQRPDCPTCCSPWPCDTVRALLRGPAPP